MTRKRKSDRPAPAEIGPAPYNPRTISNKALAGLRASMMSFGDLSGFVVNRATGNIVCGHQRRVALGDVDLGAVVYGDPYYVDLGPAGERFRSIERTGEVEVPGGVRFRVRLVDWGLIFEKAANVLCPRPAAVGS